MKVYYEYIFIINFLLDFMILYGTKKLLKLSRKNKYLLLSSVIGSLTTFTLYTNITNLELFILKIIISITMIIISFGKKNILKNTFYFYLISIIIAGIMNLFNLDKNIYFNTLILIILTPIIIYIFYKEYNNFKINIKDKYQVKIIINKKEYILDGFIDTGNNLKCPITNKPVILIDLDIKIEKCLYVPFKALNKEGIIKCIKPDKIIIDNIEINNYLIGLSENKFSLNGLNCILPNKIKEII